MNIRKSYVYTVNGHKYRDVEELMPLNEFGDEDFVDVATEVLTKHCGWVIDDVNPSFDCQKCDNRCYRYQQWEDFYSSL